MYTATSVPTALLSNNGTIAPAGSKTDVTIIGAGTNGNLEIAGGGIFDVPNGTAYLQVPTATAAITVDASVKLTSTGNFQASAQTVNIGFLDDLTKWDSSN